MAQLLAGIAIFITMLVVALIALVILVHAVEWLVRRGWLP